MTEWGFYGRKEELSEVVADLQWPKFSALRILGRRGIGKSALLAEVARRTGGNPPVLIFELPVPGDEDQAAMNIRLVDEARACLPSSVLDGLPDPDPDATGQMRFVEIIRHLLFERVAVCLDEFHHASTEGFGLTSAVKRLVDGSGPLRLPRPTGKLLVMGSHQQRFHTLFKSDQPLFQRFRTSVSLRQWRVPTVLGMAEEHGILRSPGRFLTLWTAFGGIPRNWEAFASSDRMALSLRDFAAWPDDGSWRRAFLSWQRQRLEEDPEERFDDRSHIELAEPHREILLWLALNAPRGATLRDFPAELRRADRDPSLRTSLEMLANQLELVEQTGEFYGDSEGRWSVADNNTLFQLCVFPEMFGPGRRSDDTIPNSARSVPVDRLETLEGIALERLTKDWLGGLPGVTYARQGVWRKRRNPPDAHPDRTPLPPLADIDVLGSKGYLSDSDSVLFTCGCKRNPRRHDPVGLDRQVDELLADLGHGEDTDRLRHMKRQPLLVSPGFDAERRRYSGSGYVCVDIPGMQLMAKELELSPNIDPIQLMLLTDEHQRQVADGNVRGKNKPDK